MIQQLLILQRLRAVGALLKPLIAWLKEMTQGERLLLVIGAALAPAVRRCLELCRVVTLVAYDRRRIIHQYRQSQQL